jgi:DNA/RNA-binding domain of Phe-tRNA-synthetase-like protein
MTGLIVAPELCAFVRVGVIWCDVRRVVEHDSCLDEPLEDAARAARESTSADTAASRSLYKVIGIDPTRTRPSSEALLRRVRKGQGLPRVNTVVDVGNWCSLEFQLSYGLYDAEHITPPVTMRTGGPGDEYAGIRKDVVHLAGRFALFDATGPFGNPTSDSARTMVTTVTRHVMVVVYAPVSVTVSRMTRVLDTTADRLTRFADGRESARWVH